MVLPAIHVFDSAEFDEAVTAKIFGYKDVWDYYTRASSTIKLPDIKTPLLVIQSLDDPIVCTSLPSSKLTISGNFNPVGCDSGE
jgi:uncharacterized protein